MFNVTLAPAGFDCDGYSVSEAFNSPATDTCFNMFHLGQALGNPRASNQAVSGDEYGDTVAVPNLWVSDYQAALGPGQSCGWSTTQTVMYNGTQYIQNAVGVTITSATACATRAGTNGTGCP
jgi:hypothetical protein